MTRGTDSSTTKNRSTYEIDGHNRVFLGLDRPPLHSAIDWLIEKHTSEIRGTEVLDLSSLITVVPTARAQERLLQLLVAATDESQTCFTPPIITTLGNFPEYLYVAKKKLASDLDQQIAWSLALDQTPPEQIEKLTGRADSGSIRDWQPMANLISKLHTRLANDIWGFRSVAREVAGLKGFLKQELARWEVLADLQKRYYDILATADLWDKQAARSVAASGLLKANEIRCQTDKQIVMLGTVDLNRSVSEMLRQIAATNSNQVHILIAAGPEIADRFDAFGSLIVEKWLDSPLTFSDEVLKIADQPADQAHVAAHFITHLDEAFSADQITIGVPDESVVPQLERSLHAIELQHRNLAGQPLTETAPVFLLNACREVMQTFSYDAMAALVRHPDMFRYLVSDIESSKIGDPQAAGNFLADLAEYQNSNLPAAIGLDEKKPFGDPKTISEDFDPDDPDSIKRAKRNAVAAERLNRVHKRIARLLLPLATGSRRIGQWADLWSDILIEIYGQRLLDRNDFNDRRIIRACEAIQSALDAQRHVPESFGAITTAAQSLDWALAAAAEHRVVAPSSSAAIELAGWLDLAFDDAPVMVVTGMNDEYVPRSETGHQFIPNELCKTLGILDNDRRFARDNHALLVITSVRKNILLVSGRHDESGEPLKPSRLLFADTPAIAARRAKAFFSYAGKSESPFWLYDGSKCHADQQFRVPLPVCTRPVTAISVTKFRDFMKCPYRFYLNHILRLTSISDDWQELDGGKFGDLTHNCLEAFGKSDLRDTTSEKRIFEFLNDKLETVVADRFAGARLPAVRIQIEQLRLRFEKFAGQQVAHRQQGWQIVSTEEMLEHDFDVDGTPFCIRGKIDRVDRHEHDNRIAVWDYKSSDKGEPPNSVHYAPRKKEWKDLQLPLYRHLVKEVAAVADANFSKITMGYVLLPRDLESVGFHTAEWSEEELETADETARQIIRQIRQLKFWPPAPEPPAYSEDYASICLDRVFEKPVRK